MKFISADFLGVKTLPIFGDGSSVDARPLSRTEMNAIEAEAERIEKGVVHTAKTVQQKKEILHLQRALSGWTQFFDQNGNEIPFSSEKIEELYEWNPRMMQLVYRIVSDEVVYAMEEAIKNSISGQAE